MVSARLRPKRMENQKAAVSVIATKHMDTDTLAGGMEQESRSMNGVSSKRAVMAPDISQVDPNRLADLGNSAWSL